MRFECESCQAIVPVPPDDEGSLTVCPFCGDSVRPPAGPADPGAVVAGFVLEEIVGEGSRSRVLRARHPDNGVTVALRILKPRARKHPDQFRQFAREVRLASSIRHPSLVHVTTFGIDEDMAYCEMNLVRGLSGAAVLDCRGRISWEVALRVLENASQALNRMWAEGGLIHGRLKPASILLTPGNGVRLADLGMALGDADPYDERREDGGAATPYTSPECLQGRRPSPATDVYSLGTTLYHLLTGTYRGSPGSPPMAAGEPAPSLSGLPPAHRLAAEVPAPLACLLDMMMARSADDRYADYDELLADIRRTSEGRFPGRLKRRHPELVSQWGADGNATDEAAEEDTDMMVRVPAEAPPRPERLTITARLSRRLHRWLHPGAPPPTADRPSPVLKTREMEPERPRVAEGEWWDCRHQRSPKAPGFQPVDEHALFRDLHRALMDKAVELPPLPGAVQQLDEDPGGLSVERLAPFFKDAPIPTRLLRAAARARDTGDGQEDPRACLNAIGGSDALALLHLEVLRQAMPDVPGVRSVGQRIAGHSLCVAAVAQSLAPQLGLPGDDVFHAALLHDTGKLVILRILHQLSPKNELAEVSLSERWFHAVLPLWHERATEILLRSWGLPDHVTRAAGWHHTFTELPAMCTAEEVVRLAALLSLSDVICRILGYGRDVARLHLFATEAWRFLGLKDDARTREWLQHVPPMLAPIAADLDAS